MIWDEEEKMAFLPIFGGSIPILYFMKISCATGAHQMN
jgi:hypothetical protein